MDRPFFSETPLIYGLETVVLVLTAADSRIPIDNSCITFYVGNNCTLSAILKADCFRAAISVMTRLFWAVCAVGIIPWIERVGIPVNISDIPTRGAELPFSTDMAPDLPYGKQLLILANGGIRAQTDGLLTRNY